MGIIDKFSLNGKSALITGASRGIGRAIAEGLAEAGAEVVITGRNGEKLSETQKKIAWIGGKCHVIAGDLANEEDIRKIVDFALEKMGKIDILVNAAGIIYRDRAEEYPIEKWDEVINMNLRSLFLITQLVARSMIERRIQGSIINIASVISYAGGINIPAYSASKGAVAQLTKELANEWGKYGIRVNAIAPGYIETDMTEALRKDPARSEKILSRIPLGRWGKPEDLKGIAVYLASEASSYATGNIFVVDGGWLWGV